VGYREVKFRNAHSIRRKKTEFILRIGVAEISSLGMLEGKN
jgi:hypothetical protein